MRSAGGRAATAMVNLLVYDETRGVLTVILLTVILLAVILLTVILQSALRDAMAYTEHAKRTRLTLTDVLHAGLFIWLEPDCSSRALVYIWYLVFGI